MEHLEQCKNVLGMCGPIRIIVMEMLLVTVPIHHAAYVAMALFNVMTEHRRPVSGGHGVMEMHAIPQPRFAVVAAARFVPAIRT